jgi:hypothetical protein
MEWFLVGALVLCVGYILYQAYMLDLLSDELREQDPPF